MKILTGEVVVDFHVLANEVSALNNIAISTFLHSLPLDCLVLTRAINLIDIITFLSILRKSAIFIFNPAVFQGNNHGTKLI